MTVVYSWIYLNFRILDLPLFSLWTWLLSLLLVEFTYYWTHRAMHEINILWAAHQFHHMAEDINISTTVRDSVVDLFLYDVSIIFNFFNTLSILIIITIYPSSYTLKPSQIVECYL